MLALLRLSLYNYTMTPLAFTPQAHTVPGNVRAELARSGKRQADLARALGITQQSVSARLNGRVDFTVRELELVAVELGVTMTALIGGRAS